MPPPSNMRGVLVVAAVLAALALGEEQPTRGFLKRRDAGKDFDDEMPPAPAIVNYYPQGRHDEEQPARDLWKRRGSSSAMGAPPTSLAQVRRSGGGGATTMQSAPMNETQARQGPRRSSPLMSQEYQQQGLQYAMPTMTEANRAALRRNPVQTPGDRRVRHGADCNYCDCAVDTCKCCGGMLIGFCEMCD
uniref:Uncharacterized protein n=1 Tax=Zooxanthella nutricula TaxID=1333877 RepID=A0A7S2VQM2_9DINO